MITIAIMQPTFLPWIGYFAMIHKVSTFVFLDSVQFSKRSWQQRNKLKNAKGWQWLTVSAMTKGMRNQLIKDVLIQNGEQFVDSFENTIKSLYGKTPFFHNYFPELQGILQANLHNLCELNIAFIEWGMEKMGIETQTIRSSVLDVTGCKDELLLDICKELDANTYLSAPGSRDYIEESGKFEESNVDVAYFDYSHPSYSQKFAGFEQYMSFLDLLFNEGPKSLDILSNG